MKAGMVSLGCSKNRVDSEYILAALQNAGFEITPQPKEADVIVVNTCGFIAPAKEESINTLLEMAAYKESGKCRLLVGTGCLTERYREELAQEMPELGLIWGVKNPEGLAARICQILGIQQQSGCAPRVLSTPGYMAYLRIADGCDNRCTYCAIPLIRGGRKSTPMEQLVAEAERLALQGVKELTVIAQDTSAYGLDLYGKPMLAELLTRLCGVEGLHWIRVLYTYPNTVDEALIDTILREPKLVNYIDMPIQHIASTVLRRMNRHGAAQHIRDIVGYIRARKEGFILRSTVITGFPGETEEEFGQLYEFLQTQPFDRLGAFAYSQEENTPAAALPDQVEEAIKQRRLDAIMRAQREASLKSNERRIGKTYEVLVEGVQGARAQGRSYAEAPEVDGSIRFARRQAQPGQVGTFTMVRITGADHYDLWGEEL
ncbi:MAG: 30S ribosomal protein S12 methylthiotransferase RimO [Christensenellaceae bacterium]|jgi:ribosomal protein S12 methylthiotransferase|nr:30S ribosomal protein S12 methylthiotransferase RimO [Christensenellaceae bacterium]